MRILVTGHAGFIGNHLAHRLLSDGHEVIGVDNLSAYYDRSLKQARLDRLGGFPKLTSVIADLQNPVRMRELFAGPQFDAVINLAAQAGVRYSRENPQVYIDSNIQGFQTLLECARQAPPKHFIFASSSSVYGANTQMPFRTSDHADHPLSLYAATKRSNELMAHSYAHLFGLNVTGLRFFTVYGPWGRPDMALFRFTKAILEGEPIDVYNNGDLARDFTFVGDIVEAIVRLIPKTPAANANWSGDAPDPASSGSAAYQLFNIGSNRQTQLTDFIETLEQALGKTAIRNNLPMQPGDVHRTWADVEPLWKAIDYRPETSLKDGVQSFVDWYGDFYIDHKRRNAA